MKMPRSTICIPRATREATASESQEARASIRENKQTLEVGDAAAARTVHGSGGTGALRNPPDVE